MTNTLTGTPGKPSVIQLTKNADAADILPHEVGGHHTEEVVSQFKSLYDGQKLTDMGQKATTTKGLSEGYYPS